MWTTVKVMLPINNGPSKVIASKRIHTFESTTLGEVQDLAMEFVGEFVKDNPELSRISLYPYWDVKGC